MLLTQNVKKTISATLCLVDLAGSERAANTKNRGSQLREGANINRSLLALSRYNEDHSTTTTTTTTTIQSTSNDCDIVVVCIV